MIRSLSLLSKSLIGISASFLLVIFIIGLDFSLVLYHNLTQEYESKGLAIADSVSETAIGAILSDDPASLQAMVDSLLSINGLAYVVIQDSSDAILVHTFSPNVPAEIRPYLKIPTQKHTTQLDIGNASFLHIRVPILNGEIGVVHIGMDLNLIQSKAQAIILKDALIVLIIYCFTIGGLFVLIRRFTRPIQALTDYADHLATHDFKDPLADGPKIRALTGYQQKEIQALADGFIKLEQDLMANLTQLESSLKIQERLQSELHIASEIQMSLLPDQAKTEYETAVVQQFIRPAREVGGDFLDHFVVHHRYLVTVVGDVSGKGVSAALIMAAVATMIRSTAQTIDSPGEILTVVNQAFCKRNVNEMFITVFLSVLDLHSGELRYANAGHNPPFRNHAGSTWEPFGTELDLVMGIDEACYFRDFDTLLQPDESVLFYTDGITEEMNPAGDLFGDQRVLAELNKSDSDSVIPQLIACLDAFSAGSDQADDQTLLCIRYTGAASILQGPELTLYFENDLSSISKLAEVIEQFGTANQLPKSVAMNLNLILEELIANTIYYGYDDHELHHIFLALHLDDGHISATITDDGIPFNPLEAPEVDTDAILEDRTVGGLGIHFVRSLASEIGYERQANNNVTRVKMEVDLNGYSM